MTPDEIATGFRAAMRRVAATVHVVTIRVGDTPMGMTATAVSSLALTPPSLLVCVNQSARMHSPMADVRRFCVNVLAEDQTALSSAFARSGTDKFAGVPWTPSPHGSPVLDDVVAWIDGELWAEYDGGDHTIVVARVLDLGASADRRPLLFHRGSYGLLRREG